MNTLEVVILSGFLGSGKTTLLVSYLSDVVTSDTAVIVNEVGQIDIDGAVVAEGASVPSVMLSNGCVCCSMGSDLLNTIERLQDDRIATGYQPFRRIIIECSGLSKPGPIIRSLRRLPVRHMDVRIVTAFDVVYGESWLTEHEEVAAQLAAAHSIVLTRTDIATKADRQIAAELAHSVNPLAEIIDETNLRQRARRSLSAKDEIGADHGIAMLEEDFSGLRLGHRSIKTFLLTLSADLDWEQTSTWLDDVASFCGNRLLRLKGFVKPKDISVPVLVQSVGTVFSAPRPMRSTTPHQLGVVLIARGLSSTDLDQITSDVVLATRAWGTQMNLARTSMATVGRRLHDSVAGNT